jgi:putative transposase
MQYQVVHELKERHPKAGLVRISGLLGFTRQAYYQHHWHDQEMRIEHQLVLDQVRNLRKISPRMGARKLHVLITDFMCEHQIKMGRDALFDLLADNYMLVRRKRRKITTTHSGHWFKRYPNLTADLQVSRINQLWVSDITYIKTRQGFLYLSLITDACSHRIMGYDLADNLETVNAMNALKMAIDGAVNRNESLTGLIHHSDQGFQYCSPAYTDLLKGKCIAISMSDRGQPLQNAIAERVNGIIKHEYLLLIDLHDKQQVRDVLFNAVDTYNNIRPHMSCGMMTPEKAHQYGERLERTWKNYYKVKSPVDVNQCSD